MHLRYLQWYATVYLDYKTPIDILLSSPALPYTLSKSNKEITNLFRFGLLFKMWDLVFTATHLALTHANAANADSPASAASSLSSAS